MGFFQILTTGGPIYIYIYIYKYIYIIYIYIYIYYYLKQHYTTFRKYFG